MVTKGNDVASIDQATAETIARDVLADLRTESDALRRRDQKLAATAASGTWLASLWSQMRAPSSRTTVAQYDVERMVMSLQRGDVPGAADGRREPPGHARGVDLRPGTDVREP